MPCDQCVNARNVVQREKKIEADHVDPPVQLRMREQRLQLGPEEHVVAAPVEIKRLDA